MSETQKDSVREKGGAVREARRDDQVNLCRGRSAGIDLITEH
jgi:hypothetical protein